MKSSVVNPCRLYGYGVERAESDGCFPRAVVHEVEHKSSHYGHTNEDEQEAAQLAILPSVLPAAFYDGQIQQCEIDAGKEHEEDEDVFNLYRIAKKAMLVWWVEKPPVPMVENAWQMASNGVMPTKYKLTAQAIVRKK